MALSNYGELKTAVADWAERSDLTTRIEDFVLMAHLAIVREIVLCVDLDLDEASVSLPGDCDRVVSLLAIGNPAVFLRSVAERDMTGGGTGLPRLYRVDSGEAILQPAPDATYAGRLLYRPTRTFFASDTATNTTLTRYPSLYLHGALAETMRYLRDADGEATYQGRFNAALVDIIRAETSRANTGATLQTSSVAPC